MSGLIAIVGRPNVGKSALFNRIARRRIAIVHDQPGVTRDRITAEVEWNGRPYTLVDTGGIGLLRREKAQDVIVKAAVEQVDIAIAAADVIILVVNVQEGIAPLDKEVAQRLHKSGKPVFVAVNKVDNHKAEAQATEFVRLGYDKIYPVTAIHGSGIEDLMNAAVSALPAPENEEGRMQNEEVTAEAEDSGEAGDSEVTEVDDSGMQRAKTGPLKLAIVGRPNVGKSSIINNLTNSERVIVSPIPGTTRDSVDVPFEVDTDGVREKYILIDTAGMRKSRRVEDTVEYFSVQRAQDSIARCDICLLVIDAEQGISEQDKKIADVIVENKKCCIIVINKWDLFAEEVQEERKAEIERRNQKKRTEGQQKALSTLSDFGQWVQKKLFFLDYAPVIFTSAKSGYHLDRLLESVRYIASQLKQKVPTAILNRTINDAIEHRQPISSGGHRLKFFYATQVRQAPPTFLLFVNRLDLFSDQYKKYLANEIRKAFGYEGCPVILAPKARSKTIEPIKKFNKPGVRPGRATKSGPSHAFAKGEWKGMKKKGGRVFEPERRRSGKSRAS